MNAFSLSTIALALLLGTSGSVFTVSSADAQAAKGKAAPSAESRMKMCQDRTKGIYRTQQDGWVHIYGYCLSNIQPHHWASK
jgi:hypothetical protein